MQPVALTKTQAQVQVNTFIRSVYNWMAMGLALTGFVAYYVANTPSIQQVIFGNRIIFYGLIIGELGLVFFLSARVQKIQASTATALFILYAALNGATLSFIFLVYTQSSITSTFFVCAATFVACSIYGMTTRRDLTSINGLAFSTACSKACGSISKASIISASDRCASCKAISPVPVPISNIRKSDGFFLACSTIK